MSFDLPALAAAVATHGTIARILVLRSAGSAPRGPGTAMLVMPEATQGTIGGGALEHAAITRARATLATGEARLDTIPLGPALGQCCGGSVTLLTERYDAATLPATLPHVRPLPGRSPTGPAPDLPPGSPPLDRHGWVAEGPPARAPLWIWGAGHVGRALVHTLAPLDAFAITWIDLAPGLFPAAIPPGVAPIPTEDPARLAAFAPMDADHLILTRSHDLDLALCHALLLRGFASCGLIGSATKWARFRARLQNLGHPPHKISSIACPIGDPTLGKHPQAIAIGVTAALLKERAGGTVRRDRTG
jgi:xanthine dehydrogenase accessory factor